MSRYVLHNGHLHYDDTAVITASSRGFRYGEGCFETMRLVNGIIPLWDYHYDRLLSSLHKLKFEVGKLLGKEILESKILELAQKNGNDKHAKIRLDVYRGPENDDNEPGSNYVLETFDADCLELPKDGITIGLFEDAKKHYSEFSMLKTHSRLEYTIASQRAKALSCDDMLILNGHNRVAEACVSNIFIYKSNTLVTPPLTEACIDGVMRRYLLRELKEAGFKVVEEPVTVLDVMNSKEVFLSNAFRGIRPVKCFGSIQYKQEVSTHIFNSIIKPLMSVA